MEAESSKNDGKANVNTTMNIRENEQTQQQQQQVQQSGQAVEQKLIDGRYVCVKDGAYLEYVDNQWKPVTDDLDDLKEKWFQMPAVYVPPVAPLQRQIDGIWVCPKGDTFAEYIDNEWKDISPERYSKMKEKYEDANPYRKKINGITYMFNPQMNDWFPEEVTDDVIALYNANYGVQYDYAQLPESEKEKKLKEHQQKLLDKMERKRKFEENKNKEIGWTEISEDRNTNVYVSGLPTDITEDEYIEFMSKAGIIMKDPRTNKPKIKLYKTSDGELKGDGTCCYVKMESVQLALDILDGWDLRGKKVHVEKAKFEMKGNFDPSKKKKKLSAQQKRKFMENQNRAFDWKPEKPRNYRPICECTVILKNVFGSDEMIKQVTLALDLKNQVRETCDRFGEITKVVVYENNPDGVVSITFKTVEEADYCVKLLNNGVMRGRQITAENWDGKTKYKIEENEEEKKLRDRQWEEFLKGSDDEKTDEEIEAEEEGNEAKEDENDREQHEIS